MVKFIFKVYLFCKRRAIVLDMLLRKGAMPQLLLETTGHPWCRVPTENPRHQWPRLSVFIFGVPVTFGVLLPAPGNAPAICRCVNRCGGALASCFGLVGGCRRDGIPLLRPARERVKMTRTVVGSRHPRLGRGARRV